MAIIPPITDAYINDIIKSAEPYNPGLDKTQGAKLRELIKLMRDRFEQESLSAIHKTGNETKADNLILSTGTLTVSAGNIMLTAGGVNAPAGQTVLGGTQINSTLSVVGTLGVNGVLTTSSLDNYLTDLSGSYTARSKVDKAYVDGLTTIAFKKSVRVATTANITLSGAQTIDGIALVAGDRVLVKNQTSGQNNGIYVVAAGTWTRAQGATTAADISAGLVSVSSGTVNGGQLFKTVFKATDTLGTTVMNWYAILDTNSAQILTSKTLVNPTLTTLTASATEATALLFDGTKIVTRELGANAFTTGGYLPLTGGILTGQLSIGSSAGIGTGPIAGIAIATQGSDYVDGTYTALTTTVSPAGGNQAKINATVDAGIVTAVSINFAGTKYKVGDVLSITAVQLGGTTPLTLDVTAVEAANLYISAATGSILRLENTNSTLSANVLLGAIHFTTRDLTAGGSGDAASIISRAVGTSGGAYLQFYTSANAISSGTLAMTLKADNDLVVERNVRAKSYVYADIQFLGLSADTAVAPAFSWSGDTDTGMWHSATNALGFTTGGVNRLTLTTSALTSTVNITAPAFIGALTGNASTVTNGVYTTTFNSLGDARYLLSGTAHSVVQKMLLNSNDNGSGGIAFQTSANNGFQMFVSTPGTGKGMYGNLSVVDGTYAHGRLLRNITYQGDYDSGGWIWSRVNSASPTTASNVAELSSSGIFRVANIIVNDGYAYNSPTENYHIANKAYVDSVAGGGSYLPLTGGVLSGNLTVNAPVQISSYAQINGQLTLIDKLMGSNNIEVAKDGTTSDPYGPISVTRSTSSNWSYYGLTRVGQQGIGMGIDTSNRFIIGSGSFSAGIISNIWMSLANNGSLTITGGLTAASLYNSGTSNFVGLVTMGSTLSVTGYITASSGGGTSDIRHKILLSNDDLDLSWLDTDRTIFFKWKDSSIDTKMHVGYSAQGIQSWLPDLIFTQDSEKLALNQVELLVLEVKRLKQRVYELERGGS